MNILNGILHILYELNVHCALCALCTLCAWLANDALLDALYFALDFKSAVTAEIRDDV